MSHNTVAARMASLGIVGVSPGCSRSPPTPTRPPATLPTWWTGTFTPGIDELWTSDITYMRVGDGEAYMCAIRDEGSSRVLGFTVADHMRTEIVLDAFRQAVPPASARWPGRCSTRTGAASSTTQNRCPVRACRPGPLHGSDGELLDHASAESFWSIFKHEYFYRHSFATLDELRAGVALYINFYNHQCRCAKAGNLSPIRYELALARKQQAA